MEKLNKQSRRYILIFASTTISLLALIALFIYIIDPFFQYRVRDKQYILNPIYNNPGIAKHYDYNTAIIGSSMVQNYNLEILKQDSNTKPIKLASGAMTTPEIAFLYSQTNKEKTNTYIINLDMVQFNEWMPPFRYPQYLFSGKLLDKVKYHFAYESVVRYGLTDAILFPYLAVVDEEKVPEKLKIRYSIEDIGNFTFDAIYNDIERIKQMYHNGQTVSSTLLYEMTERICGNLDVMLEKLEIEKNKDKEYIFILPPYSALYWHITKKGEYYDHLKNGVRHLCKETEEYSHIRIQFFYDLNQISDLARYSDVTHFDPTTSDYILSNIRNEQYRITVNNMEEWFVELDSTVYNFEIQNKDWL